MIVKQNGTAWKSPSYRSIFGLSALIFFLADVQGGVGPFLAIYLQADLHWDVAQIGLALATINIVAVLCQVPTGYLVDVMSSKRSLIAISCSLIIIGCLFLRLFQTLYPIIFAQSLIGLASTIIPPSIAAITMGIFRRSRFPKRVTINEFFNHLGNLSIAVTTGILASSLGSAWIVYIVIACSIASICSLLFIRPNEINYYAARELPVPSDELEKSRVPISISKLLKYKPLIIFCIAMTLFQFSNAAQLPLVGEILTKRNAHNGVLYMTGSIFVAQMVMAIIAYSLGFIINYVGRKPIFLIAFCILLIRAILYTLISKSYLFLALQVLDGIGAGIYGVITIVTISDIAKGSGRFNFSQGLIALFSSIGAGLSNLISGYVTKALGFKGGFIMLAIIAIIGLIFYGVLMPETNPTYDRVSQ